VEPLLRMRIAVLAGKDQLSFIEKGEYSYAGEVGEPGRKVKKEGGSKMEGTDHCSSGQQEGRANLKEGDMISLLSRPR